MNTKKNLAGRIADILLIVLSAVLCLGTKFVFHACAKMSMDGMAGDWMNCHWAEVATVIVGAVLTVLAIVTLLLKNSRLKAVCAGLITAAAVVTAFIPNHIVHLCMMPEMQCRAVMQPAVVTVSILLAVAGLAAVILHIREGKNA